MPTRPHRRNDMLIAALAMLIVGILLTVLEYFEHDGRQQAELHTQAELIARTASAAVVFDSAGDARDILSAFDRSPEVRSARLVRPAGDELARYERAAPRNGWLDRHGGSTEVAVDVMANGQVVAQLTVRAGRGDLWRDMLATSGSRFAVMVIALAFAWLASRRLQAKVRATEARMRYLAQHDPLTGMVNRAAFAVELEHALAGLGAGRGAALLCLDVDNFKQVNDTHGHAGGDIVLQTMAQRLQRLLRDSDVVARLGGDEFAVLLRAPVGEEAAQRVASAIVRDLSRHIEIDGAEVPVSVSVGIALLPDDATAPADAMQCADTALYHAKRNGKDSFARFSKTIGEAQRRRLTLEQDLRAGIVDGQIVLAYQPIFDGDGKLMSFEGLARWHHPQRGWVAPAEFIPVAEESGLIVELGLACLERLRRDLDAWRDRGLTAPPGALNLSSRQFRRDTHRQRFLDQLRALGLGPGQVEFELTESSVFEDLDSPASILPQLRAMGYTLAIDDFGTGYSSLAYLRRLKCRKLKIDRVFVSGISRTDDAAMLVESIMRVAHAMDMQVVAEGVEGASDQVKLLQLGCDLFQGYGLARPLMSTSVEVLLATHHQRRITLAGQATQPAPLFEA
jgi:diguanylate cyclase (GGDEF)-like protein